MKKGDKVICIKSITYTNYNNQTYSYRLNNFYKIISITDEHVNIMCDEKLYVTFTFDRVLYCDIFNEHFICLKEQRKLKLKKLNESQG